MNDQEPRIAEGAGGVVGVLWGRTGSDPGVMFRTVSNGGATLGPAHRVVPVPEHSTGKWELSASSDGHWIGGYVDAWTREQFATVSADNGTAWTPPVLLGIGQPPSGQAENNVPQDLCGVAVAGFNGGSAANLSVSCISGGSDIVAQKNAGGTGGWSAPVAVNDGAAAAARREDR